MSLLSEAMDKCVMLDKTTVDDGYGGFKPSYIEGASFNAAVVFDTSIEARVADKQGVSSLYTVTTNRNITLEYHDTFKRMKDGKIFRVTSDGDDKYTPKSATLDMRQVTAEEFQI
jgi:hypothetical protein